MTGVCTDAQAIDIIDDEGLSYAIRHYTSGDSFIDPVTHLLWDIADEALTALVEHLRKTNPEFDG